MAERQDARPQVEPASLVRRDEAELSKRMQAAPRRGPRNPGAMADLRDRHATPLVRKGQQARASPRASAVTKSGSLPNAAIVSASRALGSGNAGRPRYAADSLERFGSLDYRWCLGISAFDSAVGTGIRNRGRIMPSTDLVVSAGAVANVRPAIRPMLDA